MSLILPAFRERIPVLQRNWFVQLRIPIRSNQNFYANLWKSSRFLDLHHSMVGFSDRSKAKRFSFPGNYHERIEQNENRVVQRPVTTLRWEFDHRAANVPYFSGPGGITPPGGNTGALGSLVQGFAPDLRRIENRLDFSLLVKF